MIESLALVAKEIANSIGESAMDAVKAEIAELPDKIGELSELELLPDKVELITEEDYQIVFEKNAARNECSDEATDPIKAERESVDNTRDLTEDEKQWLKDVLGWNDNQIAKCTIDENGIIHYRTDRCDLEGKTSENGVPYERKQIVVNGITIEGVFPVFDSTYTTELPPDKYKCNTYARECNAKLKEAVQNDPELRSRFTDEQLKDIENNRTPTGYVWHHNETPGRMELVRRCDHDRTIGGAAHTGGSALWGPDSANKSEKGESF